jgi:hypothetical protein
MILTINIVCHTLARGHILVPYPGCFVRHVCRILLVLYCPVLSCPASPVLTARPAVLSWSSWLGCPVLTVRPGCPVRTVLPSCSGCPVLVFLLRLSCSGCPVVVVLFRLSCPAGLFWPGSVPMVLGYMYCIKGIINPKLIEIRTIEMSLYSVGCL